MKALVFFVPSDRTTPVDVVTKMAEILKSYYQLGKVTVCNVSNVGGMIVKAAEKSIPITTTVSSEVIAACDALQGHCGNPKKDKFRFFNNLANFYTDNKPEELKVINKAINILSAVSNNVDLEFMSKRGFDKHLVKYISKLKQVMCDEDKRA